MKSNKREITIARKRVEGLIGTPVELKVNEGRNRFVRYVGVVESMYEGIFTVKSEADGKVHSYPYSDLVTKNVRFFRHEC